jgi:hypothetical protein
MQKRVMLDIKPTAYDKNGPLYARSKVNEEIVRHIAIENYFKRITKSMNNDIETAIEVTQDANERFSSVLDAFTKTHTSFSDSAKKASSSVRVAADTMAAGLAKIEKTANFDRLERMVDLLERAAMAMNTLAEMEKSGQLAKLSEAIKK